MATALSACNRDNDITTDNPPAKPESAPFTVVEYLPAPGQFINDPAAGFDGISTQADAVAYAQKRLDAGLFVSLGAWGGYIVLKAPKTIHNSGGYDFTILGNPISTSSEPGIVWVMSDDNRNGLPDDIWYELKGAEEGTDRHATGYQITYYRPDAESPVRWTDNRGEEGIVQYLPAYHSQATYYPTWIKDDTMTFSGSILTPRVEQNPATGEWTAKQYEWGYADNYGGHNSFKISDAITSDGSPAALESVDFIKVQTGVNASCGWLGEISTEIVSLKLNGI